MNDSNQATGLTFREIARQQGDWQTALEDLSKDAARQKQMLQRYRDCVWVFVGCGTSFYLAQAASHLFSWLTGIPSKPVPASEILMFPQAVFAPGQKHVVVPISRSGTTTEIVAAVRKINKEFSFPVIAVSCTPDSEMVKQSTDAIAFSFEPEKSVVMTSSFTTMLFALLHLALQSGEHDSLQAQLRSVSELSRNHFERNLPLIRDVANIVTLTDFVFLGQGPFYGLANEACLKMQEMSISSAQSYHSLEYRHGPKSTVTEHSLITLLTSKNGRVYEEALVEEFKKLGGKTLVFHAEAWHQSSGSPDFAVGVSSNSSDVFNLFNYMPLLQMLGYFKAHARGINPDSPRNLSAVVSFDLVN
jgi:glucosamine--fructose-6-phosphate aminotransferase (isomerizing)